MNTFDVCVVGAGPAGAMAARKIADAGRSVCLLERKQKVGIPVRCGEGIGLKGFALHVKLRPEWIKASITTVRLVSPSGYAAEFGNYDKNVDKSYVLDRELMDADLAKMAAEAGAVFLCNKPVVAIEKRGDGMYECATPDGRYSAQCVILAEGVESRLARQMGWNTALSPENVESCAFTRIDNAGIDQGTLALYFGNDVAPGGYAWVFPRGNNTANVGLGVLGSKSSGGKALMLLKQFLESNFPDAHVGEVHCGGVPVGKWLRPLARDGVMVAGDAACQVNALSGGGIANALHAGVLAGSAAVRAFNNGGFHPEYLKEYEKKWAGFFGRQQERSFALKKLVMEYTDTMLDQAILSLQKEDPGRMTTFKFALRT
ncbi:MAG: geranylgeranyl reductase family protein, partial [Chitinivibrionales bacterium]|nr:geranylgeranyl reductase family protein [Chitinivibrionales bacterium]